MEKCKKYLEIRPYSPKWTAAKKTVPHLQVKKTVKTKRQKSAIAKAAIALGKLIREVKQNRISAKYLLVEVWNNQIKCINHLAETKVNKFPHSRKDLEGWLTKAYTWCKALEGKLTTESERVKSAEIKSFVQRRVEIIVLEQKKMLTSLLKRPFNKVSLDWLLVKENDQISLAIEPEEDIWQYQDVKLDERVWHSNVAINTIEQYSKSEKQSKQLCIDLGLFFVRQLLDHNEELLIDDAESCKVKEDLFSNNINTSTLQPHCGNIILDNRQKLALIEHWTEMHIQGDKCRLLKCEDCNLNTKGKENGCMISCNKNLIKVPFDPVQECPLLQLKEINYAERELVKSQNFAKK
ncbi:44958_t:CDS:2, partial [Gigaspora margarita]